MNDINKQTNHGFTTAVIPEEKTKSLVMVTEDSLEHFKRSVDNLLSKRAYFISQVLPKLKEGQDFYIIKGRKSLAKGGAEKLASIYNLTAEFKQDMETTGMLKTVTGLVAFVCNLTSKNGQLIGQGRGASTLTKNLGDANKTVKMAQKSAFIDSVIRSTGLSDLFTQDIEDMPVVEREVEQPEVNNEWLNNTFLESNKPTREIVTDEEPVTPKQRDLLVSLLYQKIADENERNEKLEMISNFSKREASENISELLQSRQY